MLHCYAYCTPLASFQRQVKTVVECRHLPVVLLTIAAHVAHHDIDAQHCMHNPTLHAQPNTACTAQAMRLQVYIYCLQAATR